MIARYAVAAAVVLIGVALREVLLPGIGDKSPFLVSILAVLIASLLGGFGPGVFATILGAGLAAALYLPPIGRIAIGEPSDLVRLAIFVGEGLLVAAVGAAVRRSLLAQEGLAEASDRVRVLLRLQEAADPATQATPLLEPLTDREIEVIRLLALGLHNSEIAATLYVSNNTVKTHLAHAYGKLGVQSRTQAVARSAALGLLEPLDPDEAPSHHDMDSPAGPAA